METQRLFFGMEVKAPWPADFPYGRLLDEEHRHLTLAFLGNCALEKMREALKTFPQPEFKLGLVAKFDQCLFLPPKHPRVVAWHVEWLEGEDLVLSIYQSIIQWLQENDFSPDLRHPFTPHVTLCRSPFNEKIWNKKFIPLPLILKDIHLYQSMGNLKYKPIWTFPLLPPFEEIDHTADLGFLVRGKSFDQLFLHAFIALAFSFPPFLLYHEHKDGFTSLEDVIIELGHLLSFVDKEIGCPIKAVSIHSHLEQKMDFMQWEMIVDSNLI